MLKKRRLTIQSLPLNLPRFAAPLLKVSDMFDIFGSADGGMHVILTGTSADWSPHTREWFLVALDGDGPQIPTVPAIILAKDLARGGVMESGAQPCVGLVSLKRYMKELEAFAIRQYKIES